MNIFGYNIKKFQSHIMVFIELPFFEVKTSILNKSWERFVYEIICFHIRVFKWKFNLNWTSNPSIHKKTKCKHSWCDCQGIGGGWMFKRCNKCGITKD